MAHSFTRQELFDLVWSEPTRTVAKRLGISDVGLAKICRRADVPLPPRGYWAKLAFRKVVAKARLPARGPGMADRLYIGQSRWGTDAFDNELVKPDPPEPVFAEPLEEIASRVRREIGAVRRTRNLDEAHLGLSKLLKADERRRERQREYGYSWDKPRFEGGFERRRLTILNSLLRALDRVDATIAIDGAEGREVRAYVGQQGVPLVLDAIGARRHPSGMPMDQPPTARMQLQILSHRNGTAVVQTWADAKGDRLETHLADIAVAIVVRGEQQHRECAYDYRAWIIRRKAELAEEQRKEAEERLRQERERLARLEKARIDRLLAQARALRRANEIRAYVEAVRVCQVTIEQPGEVVDWNQWATWALSQADRIDPVLNGEFRSVQVDDEA